MEEYNGGKEMKKYVISKAFVCGLVLLLVSLSVSAAAVEGRAKSSVQKEVKGTTTDPSNFLGQQLWQQMQHVMANETDGYLIYSSSGSGGSIHVLVKIPHLRNSMGFCVAGFILYTGLPALTMVWRIVNGSATDVVDMRVGPHSLVFAGLGFSFFLKNKAGGTGRIVAVSLNRPSIAP
jgi:hypothetical protein